MIRHIALEAIALHAEAEGREPLGDPVRESAAVGDPGVRFGNCIASSRADCVAPTSSKAAGKVGGGRLSGRAMVNAVISSGMATSSAVPR